MTTKRYDLLRHLRRHPAPSIAALARALGRECRRVPQDVEALTALDLIDRAHDLRAPFDTIQATIRL
jgi:predicted transcriptional regulator